MNELPFAFPLIGIEPYNRPGPSTGELIELIPGAGEFLSRSVWDYKHRQRVGMLLVDADGRTWRVTGLKLLVDPRTLWGKLRLVRAFFRGEWVEQELVELGPMSLSDVKDRVCASIQENPDDWREDEIIAGESGPPVDEQDLLDSLKACVRDAKTMKALYEVLDGGTLPAHEARTGMKFD